jgi:hypothetical protein
MKVLYEKRGRRYVPVAEDMHHKWDFFTEGAHLILVKPGSKTVVYNIDPDDAMLRAACKSSIEHLARLLVEVSAARPPRTMCTPEQIAAYEALRETFGGGPFYLEYDSAHEIARRFVEKITKEEK